MRPPPPSLLVLVLVLINTLADTAVALGTHSSSPSSHFESVCNLASEPTFGEIFSFVSPVPLSPGALRLAELAEAVSEYTSPSSASDVKLQQQGQEQHKEAQTETEQQQEQHHWLLARAFRELLAGAGRALAEVVWPNVM